MPSIALIHTADLHNRLTPAKAQYLRRLREQHRALLLDSGDAVSAGNVYVRPRREQVLQLMNAAGYHAMGLGNREYFFRRGGMRRKIAGAQFALLAANLAPKGGTLEPIRRWVVLPHGGLRVGVFALMPAMIVPQTIAEAFSDMEFVEWPIAAREAMLTLKDEADVVVALSHLGRRQDILLAQQEPELAAILGGHDHAVRELEYVGPVPMSYVGAYGSHAAIITLEPDDARATERELVALP